MGKSTITAPDGNKYTVNHPDGASRNQILRYVRQQIDSGSLQADKPERLVEDWDVSAATSELEQTVPILDVGRDVGNFAADVITNAPESLLNVVTEAASAVMNPVDTAQQMWSLARGIPDAIGRQAIESQTGQEFEPTANEAMLGNLADYYGGRYGSRENIIETLRTDPAGALMDAPVPAGAMSGRAAMLNPVRATGRGGRRLLEPVAESARRRDFISDMKPSTTLTKDKRRQLVDTAMEEGIEASPRGYGVLQGRLSEADDAVTARVARMEGDIDAFRPLYNLERERARASQNLATGTQDLADIARVESRLVDELARTNTTTMNPQQMNQYKRDLYRDIDWNDKTRTAENQALKAVSRGARESLEAIDPAIAADNARLGRLIDLEEHLLRGSNRMENRHGPWWQWGGVTPLLVAGGKAIERNAANIPRVLADNPAVGALTEIGWLNQASSEEANVPYLYPAKP